MPKNEIIAGEMNPPNVARGIAILLATWIGGLSFGQEVEDTSFSPDRGFFPGPITVTISSPTPGALISYTTDGSLPLESGGIASPVEVTISQSTPLRALAYVANGSLEPTNVDTHTYVIESNPMRWNGKSYTTSSAYPSTVVDSLKTLPALFIVMNPSDFATVRDSGSAGINLYNKEELLSSPFSIN